MSRYKVGDKLVVVARTDDAHHFPIGTRVAVVNVDDGLLCRAPGVMMIDFFGEQVEVDNLEQVLVNADVRPLRLRDRLRAWFS